MNTHVEHQSVAVVDAGDKRSHMLAHTCKFPFGDQSTHKYMLHWVENKLTLSNNHGKRPVDITIDFTTGRHQHRLKFGGGHGQPMARAVKTNTQPLVCDATAGFGKDAFVFASLGCTVVLLEQSVIAHALLADALQRSRKHPDTTHITERMQLHLADSKHLPASWSKPDLPDVVYLDPMYPEGKRTAKKEIQALRELIDVPQDEVSLLTAARNTATRVVVKRPSNAPPLAEIEPSGCITSPNTRYDIYSGNV